MSGTGLYEFTLPDKIDLGKVIFSGTVVTNNDPLQLGRVQVTIDQLYDNVPQANLPWAIPMLNPSLGGTQTAGVFGIPDIGSVLAIIMLNSDPKFPAYIASLWTTANTKTEVKTNYPNRYGFRDATGNILIVDKTAGTVTFTHHTGSVAEFDNTGNILLTSYKDTDITTENSGNLNVTVAGNAVINVSGNATASVTGNLGATVNGNLTATVSGTTAITSTGAATWNVPAGLTINGNLILNGGMTATTLGGGTGTITTQGTITSNTDVVTGSISLKTHVHSGVSTGGSDTGPPV